LRSPGKLMVIALSLIAILLSTSRGLAWGERGHHVVAEAAARLVETMAPATPDGRALAEFFSDHSLILGRLSYVPDSSWRNAAEKRRISAMNSPHHYFGPERVLGAPPAGAGPEFERYLAGVRSLPADYSELRKRYEGTDMALPGVPAEARRLRVYEDLGVKPWRAQELYDLLVEAFRCAKQKEQRAQPAAAGGAYPPLPSPFRLPPDITGEASAPPLPTYVCQNELPRRSDLHAAVVLAGVLAHFVGDQSQPYHPTADYDGWVTGNGGIHAYFESRVVHHLDERLQADVLERSRSAEFRRQIWEQIGTDVNARNGVAQLLINMAADSLRAVETVRRLDDQAAILSKSVWLEWGDYPWRHPDKTFPEAERRPATDARVQQAFRPVVVERLAVGAAALARLWVEAWKAGGEPALAGVSSLDLPYPHDAPFIWPAFDAEALKRSEPWYRGRGYPAHWWAPIPAAEKQWWEILPQEAGPGEVIVSKRHELGLLSNFAPTPFEFRGKRYASVEGFWQMLLYPEGPDDPRAQHPRLEWRYTREQLAQMTGFEAKNAGGLAEENMKKMGITWVSFEGRRMPYWTREEGEHYRLIVAAMRAKLEQNPEVKRVLLATRDLILKPDHHPEPEASPAWSYTEIWMKLRCELQKQERKER